MSKINLTEYVGKRVNATCRDGEIIHGTVRRGGDERYPFGLGSAVYTSGGRFWADGSRDESDIIRIEAVGVQKTEKGHRSSVTEASDEDKAIETLKKLGYDVASLKKAVKKEIKIDWSKQSAFVVGYAVDIDENHVVFVRIDRNKDQVPWWSRIIGWACESGGIYRIETDDSPLKGYTGKPEDSLHMRPKE